MTCKDCLYYEVCPLGLAIKGSTGTCLKFKNKADFVEVTRCKDCVHCEMDYPFKAKDEEAIAGYRCKVEGCYMSPEHFCGYGRRKDNV